MIFFVGQKVKHCLTGEEGVVVSVRGPIQRDNKEHTVIVLFKDPNSHDRVEKFQQDGNELSVYGSFDPKLSITPIIERKEFSSSQYWGVTKIRDNKFLAQVTFPTGHKPQAKALGYFNTEVEAAREYNKMVEILRNQFPDKKWKYNYFID